MAFTKLMVAQALVALSSATNWIPSKFSPVNRVGFSFFPPADSIDPYCKIAQNYPSACQQAPAVVSAYCTTFFGITTSTSVATAQVTKAITSTVNGVATVTITSTPTSFTSTQTCFQNTATAKPAAKRWLNSKQGAAQLSPALDPVVVAAQIKDNQVYKACSCLGVNFTPSATSTSTLTIPTVVATTTKVTATSTVTAVATAAVNQVKTVYIPSTGSYTSTNGTNTVFTEYTGYDFYGYDLYRGVCKLGEPSEVDTSVGWFEWCTGFDSCLDVCSAYNFANNKQATPDLPCVGITYDYSNGVCYLKSAVPGNGAPNCQPLANANLESAIVGLVSTS